MDKILTIFKRGDDHKVIDVIRDGCEWVLEGKGVATEKLDGTNVRLTIRNGKCVRMEKRQKEKGIKDGWYTDVGSFRKENKWIIEALLSTKTKYWPDGEHPCEAIGPKIKGNPLELEIPVCVPFMLERRIHLHVKRDFNSLKEYLKDINSMYPTKLGIYAEGLVFRHADGRMAKIKRKDF